MKSWVEEPKEIDLENTHTLSLFSIIKYNIGEFKNLGIIFEEYKIIYYTILRFIKLITFE